MKYSKKYLSILTVGSLVASSVMGISYSNEYLNAFKD